MVNTHKDKILSFKCVFQVMRLHRVALWAPRASLLGAGGGGLDMCEHSHSPTLCAVRGCLAKTAAEDALLRFAVLAIGTPRSSQMGLEILKGTVLNQKSIVNTKVKNQMRGHVGIFG